MSQAAKLHLSFRVEPRILDLARADASRRGCTVERWAEEVIEAFAMAGYHAMLPERIPDPIVEAARSSAG